MLRSHEDAPSAEKVARAALRLKPRDRVTLANRLLASLPPDADIETAWDAEIARRIEEVDSGKVN